MSEVDDELDEQEKEDVIPEEPVTYLDLKTEEPEREVDLDDYEAPKSLGEESEETEQLSDLQAALRQLHPQYKDKRMNEILQSAMVSRIPPDNILDKNNLICMSLIEDQADNPDLDIMGIISMVQDATSIGLEGRDRVEILEVAGVAHEQEMEKITKELGF